MISKKVNVMLYVDRISEELEFWKTIGFKILKNEVYSDQPNFEMTTSEDSTLVFTVYDKEFIKRVSPEVADNQPSVLFETDDLDSLHKEIEAASTFVTEINEVPFRNFAFQTPSGSFYAVRENK